jgi:serine/threonine protein kinase
MSPEQARGKPVDKCTDIWSFGVVLNELITGKMLFHGEDVTETFAKVIQDEPDLNEVPTKVLVNQAASLIAFQAKPVTRGRPPLLPIILCGTRTGGAAPFAFSALQDSN